MAQQPLDEPLENSARVSRTTGSDAIETLSSSSADTTGFMRAVDGGYIYNLQVPTNAIVNDLFTIRVRPFDDDNPGARMDVVLKIRK